jgi:hypothetical protein
MNRPILRAAILFSLLAVTGCSSHYDVTVTNRLDGPVTIWLTKYDGPYEQGLVPPEEVAVGTTETQRLGGVVIRPGETARAKVDGKTSDSNPAVLRIYRATDLNDILAINPSNPKRLDVPLKPGVTDIDVVIREGEIATGPHAPAAPK